MVVPPEDAFGEEGNESLAVAPDDSLVFVIDVQRAFPARADGAPRLTRDGFPAVVLAPDGRPGITVPKNDPPKELQTEVLKQGTARPWRTATPSSCTTRACSGTTTPSSTRRGRTARRPRSWSARAPDAQVIPGFSKALIGQQVGSQIGVIVPPSEGYGDQGNAQVPAGSTLFFVIDILGVI